MKYVVALLLSFFVLDAIAEVHVRGYYRGDGTYVSPHTRGYPKKKQRSASHEELQAWFCWNSDGTRRKYDSPIECPPYVNANERIRQLSNSYESPKRTEWKRVGDKMFGPDAEYTKYGLRLYGDNLCKTDENYRMMEVTFDDDYVLAKFSCGSESIVTRDVDVDKLKRNNFMQVGDKEFSLKGFTSQL